MTLLPRTCALVLALTLGGAGVADFPALCPPAAEFDERFDERSEQERAPVDPEPSRRPCATDPCNTPIIHAAAPPVVRPAPWFAAPAAAPGPLRGLGSPAPPTPPPRRVG